MKKIFTKAMAVVMLLSTGFTTVSCGSEELLNLLVTLTQVNGGSETTFNGMATFTKDKMNDNGEWIYDPTNGKGQNSNYNAVLKVSGQSALQWLLGSGSGTSASNSASLSIDNISVGGYSLTNIDLSSVAYDKATGKLGDENFDYAYAVSYSYNGKQYTTSSNSEGEIEYPYAFVSGDVAQDGDQVKLKDLIVYIVMGDMDRIDLFFSGTAQQNQ